MNTRPKPIALCVAAALVALSGTVLAQSSPTFEFRKPMIGLKPIDPSLQANPSSASFGEMMVGQTVSATFQVTNPGKLTSNLTYSGLPASVLRSGTCGATLAPSASCTVVLSHTPSAMEPISGALRIDAHNGPLVLTFSGSASLPLVSAASTSAVFAAMSVGETKSVTYTLSNEGSSASSLTYSTLPAGMTRTGTCSTSLAAKASCTVTLNRTLQTPEDFSGELTVGTYNGPLVLQYSGTALVPNVTAANSSLVFPVRGVNVANAVTFTLNNSGAGASNLTYSTLPAGFTRSGTCASRLTAGSSCTVVVNYTPTDTTAYSGSLTVTTSTTPVTLNFSGQAQAGVVNSDVTSVALGEAPTGQSANMTYTLTNSGIAAAPLSYGTLPSGVTRSGTCSTSLAVGASCTVVLTVTSVPSGAFSGSFTVTTQPAALTLSYSGTGVSKPNVKTFSYSGTIDSSWSVPYTGNIVIEVNGASGGNATGYSASRSSGAFLRCVVPVTAGTQLKVLVGGQGTGTLTSGGGGGGTFVATSDNTPLAVAGGGGGSFLYSIGGNATITNNGTGGGVSTLSATDPTGAGFIGNGHTAKSFVNGGAGGTNGGFGGGGAAGPGGGGGYSGGGRIAVSPQGGSSTQYPGLGGGSYCASSIVSSGLASTGNGSVTIRY